jgi:ABC-type sugar transport system ATPase subunit
VNDFGVAQFRRTTHPPPNWIRPISYKRRLKIMEYAVEMMGICKSFGGVKALKNVDLELRQGEIMGIVGDNGAGKSTLMKILSGAYQADSGEVFIFGKKAEINSPLDSFELGISMIYQDLALFNNLDVAQNIFAGRELIRGPLRITLDKKAMYRRAEELIKDLRVDIKSAKLNVARMSGGQRQMIACARGIAFQSKIMILDEPTAALGVTEANKLLGLIKNLKELGLSILLITQRIPDILAIADRVFILKGGVRQDILNVRDTTLDDVVTLIVRGKSGNGKTTDDIEYKSFG